jgi:hypothetical protein
MWKLILVIGLWCTLSFSAQHRVGPSVVEPNQSVKVGQSKRLLIVGFAGSVTIVPSRNDEVFVKALKFGDGDDSSVTADSLNQFSVRTSNLGDTIEVTAQPNGQSTDWTKWAQAHHGPEVRLEIAAPTNLNLEVFWTRGDVKISQWKASVFITSQDGHLEVENDLGDVTLRSMQGAVKLENIKGAVSIENFASTLSISNIVGRLKLRTFTGEAHIKKIQGNLVVSSQKGVVNTAETTGAMEFQTGIAPFHITEHKGPLVGHSDGGAVSAHIKGAVDVRLVSQSGPLSVSVGRESQATVSLSTKGQLNAPRELEKKSGPDAKVIQGELQGSQPGHLRLTSESGDLTLKVL